MIREIVILVASCLLSGGLGSVITFRLVFRRMKNETILHEFNSLKEIINQLQEQSKGYQNQIQEMNDVFEKFCNTCSYKLFFIKKKDEFNEKINGKEAQWK